MSSESQNWRQKVTKSVQTFPLPPRPPPMSNIQSNLLNISPADSTRRHSSAGQQVLSNADGGVRAVPRMGGTRSNRAVSLQKDSISQREEEETESVEEIDLATVTSNGVDRSQQEKLGNHIIYPSPSRLHSGSVSVPTQTGIEMKLDNISYNIHSSFSLPVSSANIPPTSNSTPVPLAIDARIFFPAETFPPFPPGPPGTLFQPNNTSYPPNNFSQNPYGPPYAAEQVWVDRYSSNSDSPPDFTGNLPNIVPTPYYPYDSLSNYGNPPSPYFSSPPTDYSSSQFESLNHFHSNSNGSSNYNPHSNYSNMTGPPMLDSRIQFEGNGNWIPGSSGGYYNDSAVPTIADPYYNLNEQNRIELDLQSQQFAYQLGMEYALATAQDNNRSNLYTLERNDTGIPDAGKMEISLSNSTENSRFDSSIGGGNLVAYAPTAMERLDNGMILRRTGICKFFDIQKGFGFILDDRIAEIGGRDIFVHYTAILQNTGFRCLSTNEHVEYDIVKATSGGYQALNVAGAYGNPLKGLQPAAQEILHARSAEMARFRSDPLGLHSAPPRRILDSSQDTPLPTDSNSLGLLNQSSSDLSDEKPLLLVKTSNSAITIRAPPKSPAPGPRSSSISSDPRGSIDTSSEEGDDSLQINLHDGEVVEEKGFLMHMGLAHLTEKMAEVQVK